MKVRLSDEIATVCPTFVGACVETYVTNTPYSEGLWTEIHQLENEFRATLTTETLKQLPGIAATRRVYRACGKDPSRYRPASEALIRRMLQGKELYQIDTLVDLVNLASIRFGYSIGGFDADCFVGDTLTLGVGKAGEPYEGIGRGTINIEGLPVYRDAVGGVGTPTSDHERTKMTLATTHLVVLINGYDGDEERVRANAEYILRLTEQYCGGHDGRMEIFKR
ncbi:MAG: phenylalanine--tRNA ligase beta subunit-related protein [Prevotella sp.]|nr:hypothetical protein [Bacteroidales bacterium]MDY3841607.1 phenylalanine--tRNA ligase beta subunit-related protein [Prevotella sp.]